MALLVIAPVAAGAAIAAAGAEGSLSPRGWLEVELVALAVVCLAPMASLAARGRFQAFDVLHVFLVFFLTLYVAKPAYQLFLAPTLVDIYRTGIRTDDAYLEAAVQGGLVALASLAAFGAAFAWGAPRRLGERLPAMNAYPNPARLSWIVGGLIVLAVGSTAVFAARVGGIGWLLANMHARKLTLLQQKDVVAGMELVKPAILLWVAYRMSPRFFRSPLNWVLLIGSLGLLSLLGGRSHLLFILFTTACLWHWYGRPIRPWCIVGLGAAGVVGFLFFAMFRMYGRFGWDYVLGGIPGRSPLHALASFFSGYDGYLDMLTGCGSEVPYNWGKGYVAPFLSLLPTPIRPPHELFLQSAELHTQCFLGATDPTYTIYGVSLLGDLYAEFSFTGVVAGMFLLGAATAFIRAWHLRHPQNRGVGLLYALAFPLMVITVIQGVPGLLRELIRAGAPLALALWALRRRQAAGSTAEAR